jgi:hypothetical protein
MEIAGIGFLVALAIWVFAIWRSHNERVKHMPPDSHHEKTSSDPSMM